MIDPLLTAKEVAKLLNISVPTLYRRLADGTIPHPIKLGHSVRWERSAITSAIAKANPMKADPDLLAAAKEVLNANTPRPFERNNGEVWARMQDAMAALREAVRKAEGR